MCVEPLHVHLHLCSSGMDLFEEALRRWEEALTFRDRQTEDDENCAAVKTGAGDTIAEHSMEVSAVIQELDPTSVTGFRLCNSSHTTSRTGT